MRALAFLALRCAAPPRRVLLRALTSDGENVHAAWTKEDDWKLWQHRDDADVAELLGRKAGGVAARLKKLEDPASTAAKRLFGEEQEETIDMEDYLALDDDALLRQCRIDYRRDSGPGGQKRNKVESAVRLTHTTSGVVAHAAEDRSQHVNKRRALRRLRTNIAHSVRRPVDLDAPFDNECAGLLPWTSAQPIGAKSALRPRAEQALLDVLDACGGSIGDAATYLGGSTGQLSKVLTKETRLKDAANSIRRRFDLGPLRSRK
jgi:hypothetical protein